MLPITGPDIGLAPTPRCPGLVGLPVWMWTQGSAAVRGLNPRQRHPCPASRSRRPPTQPTPIIWNMGDGTVMITCWLNRPIGVRRLLFHSQNVLRRNTGPSPDVRAHLYKQALSGPSLLARIESPPPPGGTVTWSGGGKPQKTSGKHRLLLINEDPPTNHVHPRQQGAYRWLVGMSIVDDSPDSGPSRRSDRGGAKPPPRRRRSHARCPRGAADRGQGALTAGYVAQRMGFDARLPRRWPGRSAKALGNRLRRTCGSCRA